MATRTVGVLAFEGAQVLDVTGPAEVFAAAGFVTGTDAYDVRVVSVDGRDVRATSGLRIAVTGALEDLEGPIDTFVVPGTASWQQSMYDERVLDALRDGAARSRRVVAVCAGAFLIGAIGLLDGRRVTTHWMFLDDLARSFPAAEIERDVLFVGDGEVYTSAGVTAGIDLALAMVEADHGPELAREVARFMVVFMQRPGGQAQFSVRMRAELRPRSPLRGLLDEIAENPAGDHRLGSLSERAGYSERHLVRVFLRELGTTPARYVEETRVEAARSMLETSDAPLEAIARRAGLGSAETLRRAFTREVGITPHAYRQRFRTTGVVAAAS